MVAIITDLFLKSTQRASFSAFLGNEGTVVLADQLLPCGQCLRAPMHFLGSCRSWGIVAAWCQDVARGGPPRQYICPTKMPPISRHRSKIVLPYKSMKSNPPEVLLCMTEASFPETLTSQLATCLELP